MAGLSVALDKNNLLMKDIEYISLQDINQHELLSILNTEKVRRHLVAHDVFNEESLAKWVSDKVRVDSTDGCIVRGIRINGIVAGWCGIQFENGSYEIAIVLSEKFWGIGTRVFDDIMKSASELGHRHVVMHMLNTRSEYKFLKKMATRVYQSTIFGQNYTSYELIVPSA